MKTNLFKPLIILLLFPLFSTAQSSVPRFENDTLYTSSGYKIYKGQVLHLAKGTADDGKFRFIKYNMGTHLESRLNNTTILVKKVYDYTISGLGNYYIGIKGTIIFSDKSKTNIVIDMNFDRAINNFSGLPAEIIVPAEFQNKPNEKNGVSAEIEKLFKLYKDGALTKEEYEAQKRKILDQQ